MFKGYFKQPEETRKTMTADGWLRTGDAGYLDAKGRLVVTDRIRDIATTATGIRFSPQFIENKLKFSPYIGECVVLGNGRPAVTAILCVRYSMVAKWAEAPGWPSPPTPTSRPGRRSTTCSPGRSTRSTAPCRRPSGSPGSCLLYKELDADDGELTRTRKVRRGVIDERYRTLIEALYSDRHQVAVETEVTFEDGRTGMIKAEMAIRDTAPEPALVQEAAE